MDLTQPTVIGESPDKSSALDNFVRTPACAHLGTPQTIPLPRSSQPHSSASIPLLPTTLSVHRPAHTSAPPKPFPCLVPPNLIPLLPFLCYPRLCLYTGPRTPRHLPKRFPCPVPPNPIPLLPFLCYPRLCPYTGPRSPRRPPNRSPAPFHATSFLCFHFSATDGVTSRIHSPLRSTPKLQHGNNCRHGLWQVHRQ